MKSNLFEHLQPLAPKRGPLDVGEPRDVSTWPRKACDESGANRIGNKQLRQRGERPRRRSSDQCDELAPPHSITSSARASNAGGTGRPSALAVLRLITSSYFVGACTGRSAGFSPLRMRST